MLILNFAVYLAISLGGSALFTIAGYGLRALLAGRGANLADQDGLFELVIDFALGVAATCFISLFAALLHVLFWPVVVVVICLIIVGAMFRNVSFASIYVRHLRRAFSGAGWIVFLIALLVAVPSVLPDITSDGQAFHLIYAKEWADAHALTIDPFVREPLYAMNWLTLDAFFETIGLGWYAPVLSGMCYVWSAVGIFATTRRFVPLERQSVFSDVICCSATISFLISPTVLHWNFTGLVDGSISFFFLASLMAALAAYSNKSLHWGVVFGLLAGYFVGMKTSLFLFIPLWIVVAAYLGWATGNPKRKVVTYAVTFLVFASPWYLRNAVLDGDPFAPTLNLLFTGHDAYWSKHDFAGQVSDLALGSAGLARIAYLPWNLTFNTLDAYREYGVSLAYLLLYLPLVLFVAGLIRERRKAIYIFSREALLVFGCFSYALIYYELTSTLARYSLVFAPTLSVCLGIVAARFSTTSRVRLAVIAVLLLLACPSPASFSWLTYNEQFVVQGLSLDRQTFLAQRLDGYAAALYVSRSLQNESSQRGVYEVGSGNLCLVLRRAGDFCVGDWTGPSRFEDFDIAVHDGRALEYVRRFDIGAFIIRSGGFPISNLTIAMLAKQLAPDRFRIAPVVDKEYIVLVRSSRL